MQKIYSRPRFKIPKVAKSSGNKKNPIKNKKIFKILVVMLIGILVAKNITDVLNPIINAECINEAKNMATLIYSEQATIIMNKYKYEDLAEIVKDDSGKIQMVRLNVNPVNQITAEVITNVQKKFNEVDGTKITIRLGSFFGIKLFSGIGPKINIRASSVGNVEANLKSEFFTAGINQTLHQIYLEITCNMVVLTPYDSVTEKITNKILIAEAIIVGEIPGSYYNLNSNDRAGVIH